MSTVATSLGALAQLVGGTLVGVSADVSVRDVHSLDQAGPEHVAFFNHAWYAEAFKASKAAAVIVEPGTAKKHPGRALLVVSGASLAFAQISRHFHPDPVVVPGVSAQAVVDPTARVDATARIDALAFIGPGAVIGARCWVGPLAHVGAGAVLGADCKLGPGSVVMDGCVLGDRVQLQPGAVLGGDGFGYAFDRANLRHLKIPQVGIVEIGADVEVGANATIDRSTMGATKIGQGTKIDNLVQVGHNVTVGQLCILCGQVGLAGSCHLEDGVVLGGQVGVANHLTVGTQAKLIAQSGLGDDVPAGETWAGTPAGPARPWMRSQQAVAGLPELLAEVRKLRAEVEALKAQLPAK